MASVASNMHFLLLLSILYGRFEIISANTITLGTSLSPTIHPTSWPSPSGRFAFGFYKQSDGFKVGIWLFDGINKTIVWTANRDDPPVSSNASLVLTQNGEFLLQNTAIANTLEPANSASMLDSGNFVLYGRNRSIIWQSFDSPTDTLLGGQNLSTGSGLVSDLSESNHSSGHFVLRMQDDGNLVAYPLNSERSDDAFWASNYQDKSISQLTLNLTGFLCLGDDMNTIKVIAPISKQIEKNTSLVIYRATLNMDGNFAVYAHTFENDNTGFTSQILWQSISDLCQVNGFCGFNSYCSNVTGKAECKCYPGFRPINNGNNNTNMFLVCEQPMKIDCITSKDPRILYNVSNPLQHIQWRSLVPYVAISSEIEACGKSCQEDCDCGAVLYEDGFCKKYKLPLRYGRIIQNSAGTALFKLPSGITITSTTSDPKGPSVLVDHKKSLILTLIFTLGSISFVCLIFAMSIFFIYMRQVHSYRKLSASANLGFTEDCSLRIFSFDELVNATGNFTEEIGRGSFGVVYKGTIRGSSRRIAVKKVDKVVDEGEKEFQAEITAIARTHHRNLVQLLGYCIDGSRKLLVYEYMSNGSLADFLFKAEMHLSWKQRVKIALDVESKLHWM